MSDKHEITLEIHCRRLPGTQINERTGVRLGLQKGKEEVVEDVPAEGDSVTFAVPVYVTLSATNEVSDFSGAFVQGKRGERFLYLCWVERTGERLEMFSRAKIPLYRLPASAIAQAIQTGTALAIAVDMTNRRGGPATGTIDVDVVTEEGA